MAQQTSNYGWTKPIVGGSNGAWGTIINTLFDAADASLKAVENIATAALAKAGGVMTGRLDLHTATMTRLDMGVVSGGVGIYLDEAQYFTLTVGAAMQPSFNNTPAGSFATGVVLRITNGGAFVITWPASVKWAGGAAPALTAAGVDIIVLITDDDGATFRGIVVAKDVR